MDVFKIFFCSSQTVSGFQKCTFSEWINRFTSLQIDFTPKSKFYLKNLPFLLSNKNFKKFLPDPI